MIGTSSIGEKRHGGFTECCCLEAPWAGPSHEYSGGWVREPGGEVVASRGSGRNSREVDLLSRILTCVIRAADYAPGAWGRQD